MERIAKSSKVEITKKGVDEDMQGVTKARRLRK
jgi:hypothetical protein